jgi:uncharacterized protein YcfJ
MYQSQMEMNQLAKRIHPLMAGAAISVMLVSLLGAAAITGVLPNSHAIASPAPPLTAQAPVVAPLPAVAQRVEPPVTVAPEVRDESAAHKTAVHRYPVQHAQTQSSQQYTQAPAYRQQPADAQPAPAPLQSAPAAQNSPIGIGVGAVVGGLLGSQVGGGNGKTLATIAGAVGGGFLGNEIAKRTP